MTKLQFFKYLGVILLYIFLLGGLVPFLVSAKSTIAVFLGLIVLATMVLSPLFYYVFYHNKSTTTK